MLGRELPRLWTADHILRGSQEQGLHHVENKAAALTCAAALPASKNRSNTCAVMILERFNGFPEDGYTPNKPPPGAKIDGANMELVNRRIDDMQTLLALGTFSFVSAEAARLPTPQTCNWSPTCNEHFVYAQNPYLLRGAPLFSGPLVLLMPLMSTLLGLGLLWGYKRIRAASRAA